METKPTIETILERLSAMESRSAARESQIISRLEALETQVSSFGTRLEALETQVSSFGTRLEALETQVSSFGTRLETLETQVSSFGGRLDALETQVTEGFQRVNKTLEHMKHKVEIMTQDIMDMRASLRALDQRIPRAIEPSVA
jgi:chromosome segregation ATPase